MKSPPLPMQNPRYKKNATVQTEDGIEEAYKLHQYNEPYGPGLGAAMGIALMGLLEARSEMKKQSKSKLRFENRRSRINARSAETNKARRLVDAQDDLYRMRNLNPKVMNKAEKKYRNQVIKDAKRTIRDASPRSLSSRIVGEVARKASPAAALFTLLDFLQGTPAGEGSAKFGPGARR